MPTDPLTTGPELIPTEPIPGPIPEPIPMEPPPRDPPMDECSVEGEP